MHQPKISIVIPAYNASNYLAEAIDSALAQTYPNFEVIVVNDGSPDNGATREVALAYGDRIRYLEKENGGSSSALNFGIAHMSGEWFSWLSHDDLYVPEKLERQVLEMNSLALEKSELANHIFFSASELINAEGKRIRACKRRRERKLADKMAAFLHNGYLIAEPTVYNFHGCSCLIHKDALSAAGGFDERLRLLNDVDLWYRLYVAGYQVHYIPDPLVLGRVHAGQISKSIGYSYHNAEQDMFWDRSLSWLVDHAPENEVLFFRFGRNAYRKTRKREGDLAFSYLHTRPFSMRIKKTFYKSCGAIKGFLKKVYLKMKL